MIIFNNKYCPKCGKKLKEHDTFCSKCGTKLNNHPKINSIKSKKKILIISIIIIIILCFIGITSYFLTTTTYKPIVMLSTIIEIPKSDSEVLTLNSDFCTYKDEKINIYAHNSSDTENAEDFNKVVKSLQKDCEEENIENITVNKTKDNYSYLYSNNDKHLEIFIVSNDAKVIVHSIKTLEIIDYKLTSGSNNEDDETVLIKVANNTVNNLTETDNNDSLDEELEEDDSEENLNPMLFLLPIYVRSI